MLDALFESWQTKNEAYFNSIVEEFKDTEGGNFSWFISPTLPIESVAQMQVSYCHRMNDHDHDLLKGQKTKKSSQGNPALMATQQSGRRGQHLLPWHSWQPWLMIKFVDKILCNHLYIVHYCFTLSLYIERCTLSLPNPIVCTMSSLQSQCFHLSSPLILVSISGALL